MNANKNTEKVKWEELHENATWVLKKNPVSNNLKKQLYGHLPSISQPVN